MSLEIYGKYVCRYKRYVEIIFSAYSIISDLNEHVTQFFNRVNSSWKDFLIFEF